MLPILWLAVPVGAAMVISGWRAWFGDSWSGVVLALLAVSWLRIDKRFEGPVLIRFSREHGVVLSDLAALAAMAVAVAGYWRHRRPSGRTG